MSSTRFHKAAKDGLIEVLKEATSSDVNEKDVNGMTPVLWAAFEGKLDALRLLVGRGGDPDKRDQFGNTALHCAAAKGHMNCVDFLVKFGTNFYALDIDAHNAKDLAAINNRDDILRYLDAAITNYEATDKKKAKAMKENADKKYDKLSKKYQKKVQKIEESNGENSPKAPNSKFSTLTQKFWKGTVKNGHQTQSPQSASQIFAQQQPTNFSSHVNGGSSLGSQNGGSTLKGLKGTMSLVNKKSTAVKMSKQQQQQLSNPFNNTEFKIGEVEPESGKRSVRSIQGLRRDSEVLYVGTFQNNIDAGKRGKIGDLFEEVDQQYDDNDEEDDEEHETEVRFANGKKFSTMSRSLSQPNFFNEQINGTYTEDNLNEEVLLQRPSGIFNRPSLGNLAIGRSVTATLSQIGPDIQSLDNSRILPKKLQLNGKSNSHEPRKFKPRSHLMDDDEDDDDSDTDVASSSDTDEKDTRSSYSALQRFLTAHELDEYYPIFEKQKIDLDTLMILTESDIKSLELPLGPCRRLINAIQQRNTALRNPGPISDTVL